MPDELKIERGNCYCYFSKESEDAVYRKLAQMGDGVRIFWRGPYNPKKLIDKYGFKPGSIIWLTSDETKNGIKRLHYSDQAKQNMEICDGTKLREGIEHVHFGRGAIDIMVKHNGYDSILRFFSSISDRAVISEATITADIDPACFHPKDYAQLLRSGKFTELDRIEKTAVQAES